MINKGDGMLPAVNVSAKIADAAAGLRRTGRMNGKDARTGHDVPVERGKLLAAHCWTAIAKAI